MSPRRPNDPAHVLIRAEGQQRWHQPAEASYRDEAALRDILADQPSLVPGVGDGAAAVTELSVPSVGPVDVAVLDSSGSITLVECKLASNPEIRRTVVGQVLAYAAGMWQMDLDEFSRRFRSRHPESIGPTEAVLGPDPDPQDVAELEDPLAANLRAGRFGIVFAVDAITVELRRIVEYLNAHTVSDVTVAALEMSYVADHGVELLLPTVYGLELAEQKRASAGRLGGAWTESDLFAALEAALDDAGMMAVRRLYDHFRDRATRYYFGTGRVAPSVTAVFTVEAGEIQPWSIWADSQPSVSVNFGYTHRADRPCQDQLLRRLEQIPGLAPSLAAVEASGFTKRPGIRVAGVLDRPGVMDGVIAAFDEFLTQT